MHNTSSPRATRRSHKCEPRNPAPPVTRTRFLTELIGDPVEEGVIQGLSESPQLGLRLWFGQMRQSADADVAEPRRRHLLWLVDIAQINDQRIDQQLSY